VNLELVRVSTQLADQNVKLIVTDEVKDLIASAGYDSEYGARPLRRVIQDKLEDYLSEGLLAGKFGAGDTIKAVLNSEKAIDLVVETPAAPAGSPAVAEALPG
jgi:ATP-dependent Clp protease ATP-binding subunit ClpC